MTIIGGVSAGIGVGGATIGAGVGIQILDIADSFTREVANWIVAEHCKRTGIEASLVGIVEGSVEIGPYGKTYTLKLQLRVSVGGVYAVKIFLAQVYIPFAGLGWEFRSCECIDAGTN